MFNEYMDCSNEVTIKIVGKLTMVLNLDLQGQLEVRRAVEETLYNYEVTTKETALATSDLESKVNYFIATKRLEGLS